MKAPGILVAYFILVLVAGVAGHWAVLVAASIAFAAFTAAAAWRARGQIQVVTMTAWDDRLGHYVATHHPPL